MHRIWLWPRGTICKNRSKAFTRDSIQVTRNCLGETRYPMPGWPKGKLKITDFFLTSAFIFFYSILLKRVCRLLDDKVACRTTRFFKMLLNLKNKTVWNLNQNLLRHFLTDNNIWWFLQFILKPVRTFSDTPAKDRTCLWALSRNPSSRY